MSALHAEYESRARRWSDIQAHLPFLYETVLSYENPVVIEFGVREGNSTSALLAAAESAGGELWSVDCAAPWDASRLGERWHFLLADDLSEHAQTWLPGQCDVLFIDTSHTYEHTLAELRMHGPRVRPGGVILLHDTQADEDGEPGTEVTEAIRAYCDGMSLEWHNRPGSYGLGVIPIA